MIFVDSNVPMYLVGSEHPNKQAARRVLERLIAGSQRLVTDAEVIQEILRRYAAIHVAVMERTGVRRLVSFDAGFDDVPGLERVWT